MSKLKKVETCLIIATGALIFYLITHEKVLLYVALGIGLSGIFIQPLAGLISYLWYKLGDAMGFVMSKIILSIIFLLLLTPIALLYRLLSKDPLMLRKKGDSTFTDRRHSYTAKDLQNPW